MVKRKVFTKGKDSTTAASSKRRKTNTNNVPPPDSKVPPTVEARVTRSMAKALARSESVEEGVKQQVQQDPNSSCNLHPLLIEHIMDKVFQYVTGPPPAQLGELKNVRLVCHQWNEVATRLFRRRKPSLEFGTTPSQLHLDRDFDIRMQGFLDVMKTSGLLPVQRFTLGSYFFIKQNQGLMKDFVRICGPEAVELRLLFDSNTTMNFNRRSFPNLNLQKLQSLHFNYESYFKGRVFTSQTNEIPYLLEVFLGGAEFLEDFHFEITPRETKWQPHQILENSAVKRFGKVISGFLPKTVKTLQLDVPLLDADLRTFTQRDLKFEELQLDCNYISERTAILTFLENQATTLRVLKILDGNTAHVSSPLDIPHLGNLCSLELHGASVKHFSYSEKFPQLKTLNLTEWKTENSVLELLPYPQKVHSLNEIFLPHRFPQAPLVKKVSQCFPNIKKLHITPSPDIAEALQETFIHFPDIEELYISFPFLLDNEINADAIFSGVSELECRRIMRHRDRGRNFDNVELSDVQRKPSITNLKKLRKLVLDVTACDVILTDFAVHFVFMKMDSLAELETSRFRISSRYLESLRSKLKLKLVEDDFSEYGSDSSDGWTSDSSLDEMENEDFPFFPLFGVGEVAFNIFLLR